MFYLGESPMEVSHLVAEEVSKLAEDLLVPRVVLHVHLGLDL